MDVNAVANELGDDVVARQCGAHQSWRAVGQRRHAVEQMRRAARPGVDGGDSLIEIGAGMSERYLMPGTDQRRDEVHCPRKLRRERDDADIRRVRPDRVQNVATREIAADAIVIRQTEAAFGLRAAVVGVDEVAFEVCGQDARAAAGPIRTDRRDLVQHRFEVAGRHRRPSSDRKP